MGNSVDIIAIVTAESWLNLPEYREGKEALRSPFPRSAIHSPPLLSAYLGPTQFRADPSSGLKKALGKILCFALGSAESTSKYTLITSFTLTFSFFLITSRQSHGLC